MDIGTGIAVGSAIIGSVAVIFRLFPPKQDKTEKIEASMHTQCLQHAAIQAQYEDMISWLNKIELKLDRVIERRNSERE